MSAATTAEIKARLVALLSNVEGMSSDTPEITAFDDPNVTINPDSLPGFVVYRPGRSQHRLAAAHELTSTQSWLVVVIAAEILDDNPQSKEEGIEAAENLLDNVILYLASKQQLQLPGTDNGLRGVRNITLSDDGAGESVNRGTKRYSTIPVRIDITKIRKV